jgi:hypothetical protein
MNLQHPHLPPRHVIAISGSRDEDGCQLVYALCNDGTIWIDTGNDTVPWRQLRPIPKPRLM